MEPPWQLCPLYLRASLYLRKIGLSVVYFFFFSIPCAFKLPYLTLWLYIGSNCHLLVICFWTRWSKKELIQLKNRAKYMKQLFKTLCIIAKLILVHYLCKIMDMEVQGRWRLFGNTWKLLHKCPEQRTRGN